jgi:hypothetical protein
LSTAKKVFFYIFIAIAVAIYTQNTTAIWCYQESANQTSICGGINTGTYIDKAYNIGSGVYALYFNYSKAINITTYQYSSKSSYIQFKIGGYGSPTNKSIPNDCLSRNPINFRSDF